MGRGLSLWAAAALPSLASALTLYVAPDGRVGPDGQATQASVPAALAVLREHRALRTAPSVDRIVLLPGVYRLAEPIRLQPADGGTSAEHPLIIEAAEPGQAVLLGSQALSGFVPAAAPAPFWRAQTQLPKGFHVLWVNGQWAQRARAPNVNEAAGRFVAGASNVVPPVPGDRLQRPRNAHNIINTEKVVLPSAALGLLRQAEAQGEQVSGQAVLLAMHSWTSSHHHIMHVEDNGAVTVRPASLWSFLRFGPDQRFALENLPSLLDAPGEWWASPDGEVRYLPRTGETPGHTQAEVPQTPTLLMLEGTARQPLKHVVLKGLRMAHTAAWVAPFIDSQAATGVPAAVVAQYTHDLRLEGCTFELMAGHGLWLRKGTQNAVVSRNTFRQLGAGALRVGELALSWNDEDRVSHHRIEDNVIEDTGRLFPGAVALWVGQSAHNRIAHNLIRRTSYSGISVGWTWGFGGSQARNNVIENNWLHDIGQGVLSDLGGIYTLGTSPGTVIRGNRIENVRSFRQVGSTAWGIYLDEGSSQMVVERNWVNGATGAGFHLHYGNDNVVRNNVFMGGQVAQARRSRRDDSALRFTDNVLVGPSPQQVWEREWADEQVLRQGNVVLSNSTLPATCTPAACSLPAALQKGSGFEPFSVNGAGVRPLGR